MTFKKLLLLSLLLVLSFGISAQDSSNWLAEFNQDRLSLNRQGMLVLGSWSIVNMTWSAFNLKHPNGLNQAYHQMNLGWNAVNLIIAGFGYYQSQSIESLSLLDSWQEQESIKRILAVNAALDIAYMAGGFYLRERAKNEADKYNRWEGFGRAIIVNGAFLLSFDLIMYWLHASHGSADLIPYLQNINVNAEGVGIRLNF